MNPIPSCIIDNYIRIYYASMPDGVHSMTFFVDVDLNERMKIINQGNRPILELGKPGTFDEDGIMLNFCYWRENALFM